MNTLIDIAKLDELSSTRNRKWTYSNNTIYYSWKNQICKRRFYVIRYLSPTQTILTSAQVKRRQLQKSKSKTKRGPIFKNLPSGIKNTVQYLIGANFRLIIGGLRYIKFEIKASQKFKIFFYYLIWYMVWKNISFTNIRNCFVSNIRWTYDLYPQFMNNLLSTMKDMQIRYS